MSRDIEKSINILVAERVRQRRKEVGLTQLAVAAQLGISFQQLQKYERGTNRITAARLYQLAGVLETKASYFYDGVNPCESRHSRETTSRLAISDSARLAHHFDAISSADVKRSISNMIRSLQRG